MTDYVLKLENFLEQNHFYLKKNIVVSNQELYLVHLYGHNDNHSFSVKLSKQTCTTISFYGYGFEETFELNDKNFLQVTELIKDAINGGVRLDVIQNSKTVSSYEFISDKQLTANNVKDIYQEIRIKSGKYVLPCNIVCSNFLGTNNFNVEIQ